MTASNVGGGTAALTFDPGTNVARSIEHSPSQFDVGRAFPLYTPPVQGLAGYTDIGWQLRGRDQRVVDGRKEP
jgi:hypothetical protein